MKRSEFLEALYDALELVQFSPENQHKNYVDIVIQEAEKMGMMPPMLPIPEYQFQADYAWEPED